MNFFESTPLMSFVDIEHDNGEHIEFRPFWWRRKWASAYGSNFLFIVFIYTNLVGLLQFEYEEFEKKMVINRKFNFGFLKSNTCVCPVSVCAIRPNR